MLQETSKGWELEEDNVPVPYHQYQAYSFQYQTASLETAVAGTVVGAEAFAVEGLVVVETGAEPVLHQNLPDWTLEQWD